MEDGTLGLKRKATDADKISKRKKPNADSEPSASSAIGCTVSTAASSTSAVPDAPKASDVIPDELKGLSEHSFTRDDLGKLRLKLYVKVVFVYSALVSSSDNLFTRPSDRAALATSPCSDRSCTHTYFRFTPTDQKICDRFNTRTTVCPFMWTLP